MRHLHVGGGVGVSETVDRDAPRRPPPPWGDEITPLTEVCGGQYVLLHELARGDLSIVYRAKPSGSSDPIAFKVMQPRYVDDEAQVRRFRREAELLRRIEHPNVVRLVDFGTIEDGRDFVALELLVGRTLAEALAEAKRMSPEQTCRIARQIGRAVRVMHKAGVIHRDLKPDNVLLIGPEDGERVKLLDFGEAGDVGAPARRVRSQDSSDDEEPEGPTYRPPEQVQKRPPQPSMDVFALGVIMFEMLTGEHPFAEAKDKLGSTIRSKAFDAPEVLLGLVSGCIELLPKDRPRSMDEVLERIDKALLWMGVVPHEITPSTVDEDQRTQPYTVADPGHVEARGDEAGAGARAPANKTSARRSTRSESRDGATVAGEMYASSGSFEAVDETLETQRRRVIHHQPRPKRTLSRESDDLLDRVPTRRRRPKPRAEGREAESRDGKRGARVAGGTIGGGFEDAERRASATGDSSDERRGWGAGDSSDERRGWGAGDSSDERRGWGAGDSSDDRRGWGAGDSSDDRRGRGAGDSSDEFGRDDAREARAAGERGGADPRSARPGASDSTPRINLDDLREAGVPTARVVDSVAWTKQQPSARPQAASRRRVKADGPRKGRLPTSERHERVRARAESSADRRRPEPRSPTAARPPIDPVDVLPRWVLPLLVMVIIALASAVWMVWTR